MRSVLVLTTAALLAVGAFAAARTTVPVGTAPSSGSFDTGDKAKLGQTIREYLMANPEVIVEAMQEFERKQESQRDAVAEKAIKQYRKELLTDPDSPIAGNASGDVTIVDGRDASALETAAIETAPAKATRLVPAPSPAGRT